MLTVSDFFPMWGGLSPDARSSLLDNAVARSAKRGATIQAGGDNCMGLLLICSGQLRVYTISEEGREITLYRLLERDICLFSASCMLHSISFDLHIAVEKDCDFYLISSDAFEAVISQSAPLSNFINRIMASRFSEVMWLMDQVLWRRMDQRLASFLAKEAALEETQTLHLTHEDIANHMGTAREVVSRMLKYFQNEGAVHLRRGSIELTDMALLDRLAR